MGIQVYQCDNTEISLIRWTWAKNFVVILPVHVKLFKMADDFVLEIAALRDLNMYISIYAVASPSRLLLVAASEIKIVLYTGDWTKLPTVYKCHCVLHFLDVFLKYR